MRGKNNILAVAKLTSKGQITIPKVVRDTLKLEEGDSLVFYFDEHKNLIIENKENCKIENDKDKGRVK